MNGYYDTLFQQAQTNLYISRLTRCGADWGEENITLDFCKIYYFLGGEGKLVINGETYYPKEGEMYLIPRGVTHSYSHNPKNPVYKYWCHFSLRFGDMTEFLYHRDCVYCKPDREYATSLFVKLCNLDVEEGYLNRLLQKSCLLELCHLFFSLIPAEKLFQHKEDEFYFMVNRFVTEHLHEQLSIHQLADAVHLQPNYFVSKFKKNFGMTPIEYINTLRLDASSKEMLQHPEKRIEEIARQFGFEDYRYFGRIFKKRFGTSPRGFRKM